jgi:hypothetical protein
LAFSDNFFFPASIALTSNCIKFKAMPEKNCQWLFFTAKLTLMQQTFSPYSLPGKSHDTFNELKLNKTRHIPQLASGQSFYFQAFLHKI